MEGLGVENALEIAEKIASDTVSSLTCNKAYMDEGDRYIDNATDRGTSNIHIGEAYYPTRALVALNQLKAASVRLTQVLDVIAKVYYEQEELYAPRVEERVPKPVPTTPEQPANRYEILAMEFDPEEYLYDEGQTDTEELDKAVASTMTRQERRALERKNAKKKTALASKKPLSSATPKTAAAAAPPSQKSVPVPPKSKHERRRDPWVFDNIDLNALVLIKRGGHYFITHRHYVVSHKFVPATMISLRVVFESSENPVTFLLDCSVFGREDTPSTEFLTRMFMSLKGEYNLMGATGGAKTTSIKSTRALGGDEDKSLAKSSIAGMLGIMGQNGTLDKMGHLHTESRRLVHELHESKFRSEREKAEYMEELQVEAIRHLKKIRNDLISVSYDSGTMIISRYSICRDKRESLNFEFNKYSALDWRVDANKSIHLLVDRRVLDFDLEESILREFKRGLHALSTRENTQRAAEENPFLFKRMNQFINCAYGKTPQHLILLGSLFANFGVVDRPDNPQLHTVTIDFNFDQNRAAMVKHMGQMIQDNVDFMSDSLPQSVLGDGQSQGMPLGGSVETRSHLSYGGEGMDGEIPEKFVEKNPQEPNAEK